MNKEHEIGSKREQKAPPASSNNKLSEILSERIVIAVQVAVAGLGELSVILKLNAGEEPDKGRLTFKLKFLH